MIKANALIAITIASVVILLAIIAGYTGNIALRHVEEQSTQPVLSVTEPVVLGVSSTIRWTVPTGMVNTAVDVRLRTFTNEEIIGSARLSDKSVPVTFPCNLNYNQASLQLVNNRTGEVLAFKTLETFKEGQDCAQ